MTAYHTCKTHEVVELTDLDRKANLRTSLSFHRTRTLKQYNRTITLLLGLDLRRVMIVLILTISSFFLLINAGSARAVINQAHCTNPSHPAGTGPNACSPDEPIIFKGDGPAPQSGTFKVFQSYGCNPTSFIVYQTTILGPYMVTFELPSGQYSASDDFPPVPFQCINFDVSAAASESVATATGLGDAAFTASAGVFSSLTALPVGSVTPSPPGGLSFPDGLFSFTVVNLSPAQVITVTITLPVPFPAGSFAYYKLQSGAWSQYPTTLDSTRTVITLSFTADGSGTVNDPGGPAQAQPIPEYPLGLPVLAIFMLVAYELIRRRTKTPKNT